MEAINKIIEWTKWKQKIVLEKFGISKSEFYRWQQEEKESPGLINPFQILEEEVAKVVAYRQSDEGVRSLGYRKFTWKMVDDNIAYLTESSVYRVLRAFKLLGKAFKEKDGALKEYQNKPLYVNHHWHTDIAYVILGGIHYYLIFMLDGYSRYLLHWELMTDMAKSSVEIFIQNTLDKYPGVEPMIIHDNGSQFISHEFKQILFENNCKDIPTRLKHPETNGKAERFVGLIRTEALRLNSPSYYAEGKNVIKAFVHDYNNNRYHAGIKYLKPVDVFNSREHIILAERKEKLKAARERRYKINSHYNSILMEGLPA
jgi:putative transposase